MQEHTAANTNTEVIVPNETLIIPILKDEEGAWYEIPRRLLVDLEIDKVVSPNTLYNHYSDKVYLEARYDAKILITALNNHGIEYTAIELPVMKWEGRERYMSFPPLGS